MKRIRFDDTENIWADVQMTNEGAYRMEGNVNGGYDVYVVATGEKIVNDTTSWHSAVRAIERHLNRDEVAAQREP